MLCPHCQAENPANSQYCTSCNQPLVAESAPQPELQQAPPYQSSGRCPGGAWIALLLGTLVGGFAVGALYHLIARWFDLLILFPIGVGFLLAGIIGAVAKGAKCRNGAVIVVFAILAGLTAFGTRQFMDAMRVRPEMVQGLSERFVEEAQLTPTAAEAKAKELLTPVQTFILFTRFEAESGVTISHRGSGGFTLKGTWFWVLTLVELLLIAGVACAGCSTAYSLFCEKCDEWYSSEAVLRTHPQAIAELLKLVRSRDWAGVVRMKSNTTTDVKNHCDVEVQRCPACRDSYLRVTKTVDNTTSQAFYAHITPDDANQLLKGAPATKTGV